MSALAPAATLLSNLQFDSSSSLSIPGWTFGSQNGGTISVVTDKALTLSGSSGSIRATYPASGCGVCAWGTYSVKNLNTREVYVEFWAKMPQSTQGLKFLKVFGQGTGSNYANTTFGLDYTGGEAGSFAQVSFGDGSSTSNDTTNVIKFNGTYPQYVGRSYGKATISTPQLASWSSKNWGTSWHRFKLHVKFNSGTSATNEVADGAVYVEIDGKVYLDAKNIFNRHYSNLPIDRVELFGWAQGQTSSFEIWYDSVKVSTGGFSGSDTPATSAPPAPPASLKVNAG